MGLTTVRLLHAPTWVALSSTLRSAPASQRRLQPPLQLPKSKAPVGCATPVPPVLSGPVPTTVSPRPSNQRRSLHLRRFHLHRRPNVYPHRHHQVCHSGPALPGYTCSTPDHHHPEDHLLWHPGQLHWYTENFQ